MPKSKRPRYERQEPGSLPGEGVPLTAPIIFTKDAIDPRKFVRPGERYMPYFTVPSRLTMIFVYVVIAGVCALVLFGCVLAVLRG